MNEHEEEFLPDFKMKELAGLIASKHSKLLQVEKISYVSAFNKVNAWNPKTGELIKVYGSRKQLVTSFNLNNNYIVIGYDNGIIEIAKLNDNNTIIAEESKILKIHSKRVTSIEFVADSFISSSLDGTISLYDITLEELRVSYKGNTTSVFKVMTSTDSLFAICGDKTIKVWKLYNEDLFDALAFDDYILDAFIEQKEALIFFKTGKTCFYNLENKTKRDFDKFKKLRNIQLRNRQLAIQCQKETFLYEVVNDSFGLKFKSKHETSDNFIQFDFYFDSFIFITKQNSFEIIGSKSDSFLHDSEILHIETFGNTIYTFSEQKIIQWSVDMENDIDDEELSSSDLDLHRSFYLSPVSQIKIENSTCFAVLDNQVFAGGKKGLYSYSLDNFSLIRKFSDERVDSICTFNSLLAFCTNTEAKFYDNELNLIDQIKLHDPIIYSRFSNDGSMFCVSTIDSKIYVYNFPDLSLRFSLYGHSLPVRSFSISPDNRSLISCGADKLLKIWGLELGECKKTIVGNARNLDFVNNSAYIFGDKNIMYFNGFNKLRKFDGFSQSIVKTGKDFFVASAESGLIFYKMNKFEFAPEESSEEDQLISKTVVSVDEYDIFLQKIEKLEEEKSEANIMGLYSIFEDTDFTELMKYIYVLDTTSIYIILYTLEHSSDRNIILNAKIFLQLFKFHKEACLSYPSFSVLKKSILGSITECRNLIGSNEAYISVDINDDKIQLEF